MNHIETHSDLVELAKCVNNPKAVDTVRASQRQSKTAKGCQRQSKAVKDSKAAKASKRQSKAVKGSQRQSKASLALNNLKT